MSGTRLLMAASAIALGVPGVVASFAPDHLLRAMHVTSSPAAMVLVQLVGAAYLGYAMLNWTAQHNLIGGIYSRPVAIGNLLHFMAAGLALLKALPSIHAAPVWLWALAVTHAILAACFGLVLFRHPISGGRRDE